MFGLAQADAYVAGLERAFALLADYPRLGRDFGFVKPGVRRHESQSHSIYYRIDDNGDVFVLRVLGGAQDPGRHL